MWDEKDITVKGMEAIKRCDSVYLESYTSKLNCSIEKLQQFHNKKIIKAGREFVEDGNDILSQAKEKNVALLVIGDPFGATTHIDLKKRALDDGIKVEIIHNASILNAIGSTGIDLYKFGKTTSIPFENRNITSPLDAINLNQKQGLSTLVLFDLNPESNKFMHVKDAMTFLLDIGLEPETICIGCSGIGSKEPEIKAGKAKTLKDEEFTLEPQCLVIPGKIHFIEEEMIKRYWIG